EHMVLRLPRVAMHLVPPMPRVPTTLTSYAITAHLTQQGYRSPQRPHVLPSTVQTIRLTYGLMHHRHPSHPRRKVGYMTIPQLAQQLGVSTYWLHDRMQNGHIQITKDATTGVYLFPDHPATLEQLRQLHAEPSTRVSFI